VQTIVQAAVKAAEESGLAVADLSLDAIARRAGVSRTTLFRRIGSRRRLEAALRAAGVEPGERPGVRARAVAAAADIVRERGFAALTLEAVAVGARCSVPALHSQLGGREGLLAAMFERYSPLPRVEAVLAEPAPPLSIGVRAIYGAAFDAAVAEPRLVQGLFADALGRPDGPAARFLIGSYLPRAVASLGRWLEGEVAADRCRPLPTPLLVQLLVAPIVFHATTRGLAFAVPSLAPPPRDEVIEVLAAAYLRAVALPPNRDAAA